jgi:hypothetical protein
VVVTVWALPKSTLVRVGIAHVRLSIYVAHPTSDSQFSAVLPPLFTPLQWSAPQSAPLPTPVTFNVEAGRGIGAPDLRLVGSSNSLHALDR